MRRLLSALVTIGALVGCGGSDRNTTSPSAVSSGAGNTTRTDAASAPDFALCLEGASDARCFGAVALGAPAAAAAVAAPGNLVATAVGGSVTLTWTAPGSGDPVTSYVIEAGAAAGLANLANFQTGNTATTYSASGVAAGTYYVRVRAVSGSSVSAASNEAILVVTGGSCVTPGAPGSLSLTANSGGTVAFSWTAASGAPTTYIFEAGSATGLTNLANTDLRSVATSFSTTGVSPGTYYVRVRGRNACGTGAVSNEVVLVVGGTTPGASDLVFIPDAGFRKESASNPAAGVDASGTV